MTALSCYRSPAPKKCKSVAFKKPSVGVAQDAACMVQIHWIPPNSDEDIQARWHSKDEYNEIKSSAKKVVRAAYSHAKENMDVDWDHEDYCIRGLEVVTPHAIQEQRQRRQMLLAGVWNAQVRQWNQQDRIFDPEAIAMEARKQTKTSACLARSFAMRDELAANKYYETEGKGTEAFEQTVLPLEEPSFHSVPRATAA